MNQTKNIRERIYDAFVASGIDQTIATDLAFHMTDWKEDFDELAKLYYEAERLNDKQIRSIIIKFLAHVPNHVAAAKKLSGLGPIEDIFGAKVFEEDD